MTVGYLHMIHHHKDPSTFYVYVIGKSFFVQEMINQCAASADFRASRIVSNLENPFSRLNFLFKNMQTHLNCEVDGYKKRREITKMRTIP